MDLKEFKCEAQRRGHFYDNSESASEHWAKTWGLTYHSLLWFYKDYKLGNMEWKGGKVRLRHGSYQSTECYIDGELVSEYRFKKALASFKVPELTKEEQAYIDNKEAELEAYLKTIRMRAKRTNSRKKKKTIEEPLLPFVA